MTEAEKGKLKKCFFMTILLLFPVTYVAVFGEKGNSFFRSILSGDGILVCFVLSMGFWLSILMWDEGKSHAEEIAREAIYKHDKKLMDELNKFMKEKDMEQFYINEDGLHILDREPDEE